MDSTWHAEESDERSQEALAAPLPPPPYAKPELRVYGRLQPRLQFTPPNPP